MAEYKTISPLDLVAKFQYTIDNHWGYIYGTAGTLWTQAKQNAATREQTKKYGSQWIGHYVSDCSGLFYWAFKQLGSYMYHGSNTMYKQYCVNKGRLVNGKRSDGNGLLAGTAIFTGTETEHGHVGLYIGNGIVIEAKGTQAGVVKTPITDSRWTFWGEMKYVDYSMSPQPQPEPPVPEGYAEVIGKRVALRKAPTTQASIIMRINTGEMVKIETPPPSEWEYVSYENRYGYMMKEFLNEG